VFFEAPRADVAGVQRDTEEIGGNKTELRSAQTDDANNHAVDRGDDPALPQFLSDEDRGEDGQNTRQIIQSKEVEHVLHVI
jgi:hypothetical protein